MSNNVAIVTGASSGIGLELAKRLHAQGHFVVGVGRTEPEVGTWVGPERATFVQGNVADASTSTAAFAEATSLGGPHLLINSAGTGVFGPVGEYSEADVHLALEGNLIGMILFSDAAIRAFGQRGGQIVNIISTAATVARPNETVYCAAKWGARGYTESIRAELKGRPIDVVAVYPGGLRTPFWQRAINPPTDGESFMDPGEVADIVIDALSPRKSGYVSDLYINRR